MEERKVWIDYVKAICMIGVYILHSEAYYGTGGVSYGYALSPFYVNAFFFMSGYLFLKKRIDQSFCIEKLDILKKEVANLFYRLVVPSILFASLIYIPKMFFHANDVSVERYLFDVFGGISYWFTSALVVAQIFLLFIWLCGARNLGSFFVITLLLFCTIIYYNGRFTSSVIDASAYFPWFYKTGIVYTFVMTLGGIYYNFEKQISSLMRYGWVLLGLIYFSIIIVTWNSHSIMAIGLGGKCNLIGFIAMICGTLLLIELVKRIKSMKWLIFIGKNSIVFYFLSGVLPAICGTLGRHLGLGDCYIYTLMIAFLSLAIGFIVTKFVIEYLPFLIDIRKISRRET